VSRSLAAFAGVTIPDPVAAAVLDTTPALAVAGVYVPSRDRSAGKTEKKQTFVASLLATLDGLPAQTRDRLVLSGDYNVIARTHQPLHSGFLPFEFELLERLEAHGLVDAYKRCSPNEQAYSWIGRTGDGYRYDYFHVGQDLAERIRACGYLHETRERRLTDHAAVSLTVAVDGVRRRETSDPNADDQTALF
jgi:exodeoxyribonuclease III